MNPFDFTHAVIEARYAFMEWSKTCFTETYNEFTENFNV